MSTLNQTYKDLAIPYFKEVFDIIDNVLVKEGIPYYLIGATAIVLEFSHLEVIEAGFTILLYFKITISTS